MAARLTTDVGSGEAGSVLTTYALGAPLDVPSPGTPRETILEGASVDGAVHVRFDIDDRLNLYFVHSREGTDREVTVNVEPLRGASKLFLSGTWSPDELNVYAGDGDNAAGWSGAVFRGTSRS